MAFFSILFRKEEESKRKVKISDSDFVKDLNLDQIIDGIVSWKKEYNLKPFFYTPLEDIDTIKYRHEVMKDLQSNKALYEAIHDFANKMRTMRRYLHQSEELHHKYQKEEWYREAVEVYCDAVTGLLGDLNALKLNSQGFLDFRLYLSSYIDSYRFKSLYEKTRLLKEKLSNIRYNIFIKGNKITVSEGNGEPDYSKEVLKTFEKFKQGSVETYTVKLLESVEVNYVEGRILDMVSRLYPDVFSELDTYYLENREYIDEVINRFDREVQFYISYLDYISPLIRNGLDFCYPELSRNDKEIYNYRGFDLLLAHKLINTKDAQIVPNDFYLKEKERIFVVTGPNQGGKTTFARSFGQIHYFARLGCPVPGKRAKLFLFDNLFTHFEREEDIKNLHGKLEDELLHIHNILSHATSHSIIILNEPFSSTTLEDAIFLSKETMGKIIELDLLAVWVTFIDELTTLDERIVSMVSEVSPKSPTLRTYKIVRKPADGLSYAISIAERHGLTYKKIKERLGI